MYEEFDYLPTIWENDSIDKPMKASNVSTQSGMSTGGKASRWGMDGTDADGSYALWMGKNDFDQEVIIFFMKPCSSAPDF